MPGYSSTSSSAKANGDLVGGAARTAGGNAPAKANGVNLLSPQASQADSFDLLGNTRFGLRGYMPNGNDKNLLKLGLWEAPSNTGMDGFDAWKDIINS